MLKRVFEFLTVLLIIFVCTTGEHEKIDFSWLPKITLDIDKMASLKIEEEFKLSKARTHMVAYEKLRKFRKSKFNKKNICNIDIFNQSNH